MSTTQDQAAWERVIARLDALEAERPANARKVATLEQANAQLQKALAALRLAHPTDTTSAAPPQSAGGEAGARTSRRAPSRAIAPVVTCDAYTHI